MEEVYENPVYSNQSSSIVNNKGGESMSATKPNYSRGIIVLLILCLVTSTVAVVCASIALIEVRQLKDNSETEKMLSSPANLIGEGKSESEDLTIWMRLNKTNEKLEALENQMRVNIENLTNKADANASLTNERLLSIERASFANSNSLNDTQREQQAIHSSLQSLESAVESYHEFDDKSVACPSSYKLNPYSKSCIRIVLNEKSWEDAKNYCEVNGEYLTTFETLESAFWFINLRKTIWKDRNAWLGGRLNGGAWIWAGQQSKPIDSVPWGIGQPGNDGGSQDCLVSWKDDQYTYHDWICQNAAAFICEKFA